MNIKETFLKLTSRTYPHGTEDDLIQLLGINLNRDKYGNRYILIGEKPDTMFTSHLDTADSGKPKAVRHLIEQNIIKTDGNTILGADDKAGVTLMLYMINQKVPGLYYFFIGEEVGCRGSRSLAQCDGLINYSYVRKVISFDRRGTNSVITHQSRKRTASDEFAQALAGSLNNFANNLSYTTDSTGICTDSLSFVNVYPECTNISVGYLNEHTFNEYQDILHLENLAKAAIGINWRELPVYRNPW
jgi:hypothetical protein